MIINKIKQIKYQRLKPEERFLIEIIDGIVKIDDYTSFGSTFWKKNDLILFEQDLEKGWLRVNYELIWGVLYDKYNYLTYEYIQSLVIHILKQYTKMEVLLPHTCSGTGDVDCRYIEYKNGYCKKN